MNEAFTAGSIIFVTEIENPDQAGMPSAKGPVREYRSEGITVLWDATRCIHVGECLRALPGVFNTGQRPWVNVNAAAPEKIAEAVRLCPTDALRYRPGPGLEEERPAQPTTIEARPNGPLYVRGKIQMTNPRDEVIREDNRVALCRCGASNNKPFCDNRHREIKFRA